MNGPDQLHYEPPFPQEPTDQGADDQRSSEDQNTEIIAAISQALDVIGLYDGLERKQIVEVQRDLQSLCLYLKSTIDFAKRIDIQRHGISELVGIMESYLETLALLMKGPDLTVLRRKMILDQVIHLATMSGASGERGELPRAPKTIDHDQTQEVAMDVEWLREEIEETVGQLSIGGIFAQHIQEIKAMLYGACKDFLDATQPSAYPDTTSGAGVQRTAEAIGKVKGTMQALDLMARANEDYLYSDGQFAYQGKLLLQRVAQRSRRP